MQSLLMNSLFHFVFTSVNLSAGIASLAILADQPGIISSAIPANQPVVPSASTSQRREIALKQVSYPIFILIVIST